MQESKKALIIIIIAILVSAGVIYFASKIKEEKVGKEEEAAQKFPQKANEKKIYEDVFPFFVEGGWQKPENALNRSLTSAGFFEEFSYDNSAHFNKKIAAEKIIQETEENQEENQEIPPELKNSLVFWGFSSPNVDKKFHQVFLRISLAAKKTLEDERLILEYSLDNGGTWQSSGIIKISGEISNQENKDYWSLPLTAIDAWKDLNTLRIKVTYKNSSDLINDKILVFFDSLWLEVLRDK